jgi:hypothetical protein
MARAGHSFMLGGVMNQPQATPTSGYIAISVHELAIANAENGSFESLKRYHPIEKIGKSIYLFHLPPN